MKRLFLRPACLACVAAMTLGCDSGGPVEPDPDGNPGPQTGTIQGTVTIGGSAMGGAQVSLTGAGVTRTATSGTDGAFAFADLPPGSYTLTAAAAGATCESASAAVQAGQTAMAHIACAQILTGAIAGSVTAGGEPLGGVFVALHELGHGATTDAAGAFAMTAIPPGAYTLVVNNQWTTCESASVTVAADQTVPAAIVCQRVGALEVVIPGFLGFAGAITISGPVARSTPVSGTGSFSFRFLDLPPGDYTVTAASSPQAAVVCELLTAIATIETAQISTVTIGGQCELRQPLVSEIAGSWNFGRSRVSSSVNCPAPLPNPNFGEVSMTFDSGNGTVRIEGLDPSVAVVGPYDPASGHYAGQGSMDLGGGSSIRTEIEGVFAFEFNNNVDRFFVAFDGQMKREHRAVPGGSPICTEEYVVLGSIADPCVGCWDL